MTCYAWRALDKLADAHVYSQLVHEIILVRLQESESV